MVFPQIELSDHWKIVPELKESPKTEELMLDNYNWEIIQNELLWDNSLKPLFSDYLENDSEGINDIKQRIEEGLIGSTDIIIQEFFMQAAKNVF